MVSIEFCTINHTDKTIPSKTTRYCVFHTLHISIIKDHLQALFYKNLKIKVTCFYLRDLSNITTYMLQQYCILWYCSVYLDGCANTVMFFMVPPCIDDIKFFICPTNADRLYEIVKLLKQLELWKLLQHVSVYINHRQGATARA
jgi:hypothetical protein